MEGEVYRRRRLQCADRGVLELPGVEHQPLSRRAAVARVAEDGVADGGEMDADLVRAAGLDVDLHERVAQRTHDRQRRFPVDWRIDRRLRDRRVEARQIDLADRTG